MINKLKIIFTNNIHLSEILKGSTTVFIFKLIGMVLGYIFTLLLTRNYGAETMGMFSLSLTLLNIFVTISIFGLDTALIKFVAEYRSKNEYFLVKETYQKSFRFTTLISFFLALIFFLNAEFFAMKIFKNIMA